MFLLLKQQRLLYTECSGALRVPLNAFIVGLMMMQPIVFFYFLLLTTVIMNSVINTGENAEHYSVSFYVIICPDLD